MQTRLHASEVSGQVADISSGNPIAGARVTLFTPGLQVFREARTTTNGTFAFNIVALGDYRMGVAALGHEYQESNANVTGLVASVNFALRAETNGGRWTIVGNTEPELFDGSGSGSLLPNGDVFFFATTRATPLPSMQ